MKKRLFPFFEFLAFSGLFYFQINILHSTVFGILFFLFSLFVLTSFWKKVFDTYFEKDESVVKHALSFLMPMLLFGFFIAPVVCWYHLNSFVLTLAYFFVFLFSFEVSLRFQKKIERENQKKYDVVSSPGLLPAIYLILYFFAWFAFLSPGRSIGQTPWQFLSPFYLILFFLLTTTLGLMLISSVRTKLIIFFLILHSIVLHMYIPMSHQMPFGGDVWRTIAVEEKLSAGEPEYPVLFGSGVKWKNISGVQIPEALLIPNKYVYSHLWSESVFLSKFLAIDLVTINRFLVPIIWSLFVPVLLFALGKRLFYFDKNAIFFSFLSFLPFSLQALGGLTLAVSWGFIQFILFLLLFVEYLRNKNQGVKYFAFFLGAGMLFGYTLFFLLAWLVIGISSVLNLCNNKKVQNLLWVVLSLVSFFILPTLEIVAKFDWLPQKFSLLSAGKKFLSEWSGWSFARHISPIDLESANVIFNHTPSSAFVQNFFTAQRWHVVVLMLILFLCILSAFYFLKKEKFLEWKVLTTLLFCVGGGYILGWYVLLGERFFIRRLDSIFAILLLLFACYGFFHLVEPKKKYSRVVLFLEILFVSFSLTTVYASGPDLRVVSTDEYEIGKYLAQELNNEEHPCVLADTWLLLTLEASSKGKIVGGGFPIDTTFGQKERVFLYNSLFSSLAEVKESEIIKLTGAQMCFIALPRNSNNLAKIREKFGNIAFQNETLLVWKVQLKNNE